jgi:hypothetical protein
VAVFGKVEIADADFARLTNTALIQRLVAGGASRLTAERIVALKQSAAEPGRARPHGPSRR